MRNTAILFTIMILLISTSCEKGINVNLGCKYRLINSASFNDLTIVKENNIVVIDGHILDYAFDSAFIIVAQRPRDSVPGIETMKLPKYLEAFEQSSFRQYWIINKKEEGEYSLDTLLLQARYSNVYGPYRKDEFLRKLEVLKISNELKLRE